MQEKCMIWHLGFCEVSFWKEKKEDCWLMEKALPTLEFKKFTDFPRGTMYDRKPNETESAFTGDFLYYEIVL